MVQRITPGSRLNALGVYHRFFNPLSPSKQNMPRTRKPSNDADDASKKGDDDAASISLASLGGLLRSTRAAAREKKKVDDDTFSAAGLLRSSRAAAREKKKVDDDTLLAAGLPRPSRAAARQKKKVPHESFAAASTIPTEVVTRLYHRGKLVEVIQSPKKSKNDVVMKLTLVRGNGLLYSEDDVYLNNVDEDKDDEDEYEDNDFSSVHPDNVVSRNRIHGGLQRPDTSKMSKHEEELALDNYKKKRKLYTDAKQKEMAKQLAEADITTLQQQCQMHSHNGDQTPSIRLMMVVKAHLLVAGQTFQHKETLQIHIAEEANLRNIKVKIVRSSHITYIVRGYNFYIAAGYQMQTGWLVHVACCREGDDVLRIPPNSHYVDERQLCNLFCGKWIGYLLRGTIEDCPGATRYILCFFQGNLRLC